VRLRDRIAVGAGITALSTAVLALGGAPTWSVVVIGFAAALAVASQVTSRRRLARVSPLVVVLGAAAALTALQLVPLPDGVLAALDPGGHELVADSAALTGDRGWMTLSLDPGNTRRALLELVAYLGLAWVALRFAASEVGRFRILAVVAVACGAAAFVGATHYVLGASALYGVYTPHRASPDVLAPLLNSNHFACLLALGAAVSAGLAMYDRQSTRARALWIVVGLGCVATALLTHSRGGAAGLAVAAAVFGVTIAVQRLTANAERRTPDALRVTVPALIIVVCTLVSVVWVSASGGVSRDVAETRASELSDPLSKYAAWRSSMTLIEASPWVGVGRGGFEASFTRVHPASAYHTFSHLENEYLQAVVDWGIPGAVILAGGLAWLVLFSLRRWRDGALAAGALAGAAAVATQSVVDFGVEMPGVAIPTILVASTLAYVRLREGSPLRGFVNPRAALVVAVILPAIWVASPTSRTLSEDHDRLTNQETPSLELAQDAMRLHPLDYLAPAYAAAASRAEPAKAMAYLNRALTLHPSHPDLHRVVARLLVQSGRPGQARVEYQLALRGTSTPEALIEEIVRAYPDAASAAAAIPADYRAVERVARTLANLGRPDVASIYLQHVVEVVPHNADAWQYLLNVAEARNDLETAEKAAKRRSELLPSVATTSAYARILIRRGKVTDAERVLAGVDRMPGATGEQVAVRLLLCDVYIEQKQWQRSRECLSAMRDAPAVRPETRRQIHARMARVEEALGNLRRAAFERAAAQPR